MDVRNTTGVINEHFPLFQSLPEDVLIHIKKCFRTRRFHFGEVIVREGSKNTAIFLIKSGRARAVTLNAEGEEVSLGILREGDLFGEMSLLYNRPSIATVRSSAESEVLYLEEESFKALLSEFPSIREHLIKAARRRTLRNFLKTFSGLAALSDNTLDLLLNELDEISIEAGTVLIRENDPPGPMYIVRTGRLKVYRESESAAHPLAYIRQGDYFGELSLFRRINRSASVVADTHCELLRLSETSFNKLMTAQHDFKTAIEKRAELSLKTRAERIPLDFICAENDPSPTEPKGPVDDQAIQPQHTATLLKPTSFPVVYQIDDMDCGAACLAMILRAYGYKTSLIKVREAIGLRQNGASISGICRGASLLGFNAEGIKLSKHRLDQLIYPAIFHFDSYHWVVIWKVTDNLVYVADPANGKYKLKMQEFLRRWDGYVISLAPTQNFGSSLQQEGSSVKSLLRFLPHSSLLIKVITLSGMLALLKTTLPAFLQLLVDRVILAGDISYLNTLAASAAVITTLIGASTFFYRNLMTDFTNTLNISAFERITAAIFKLPASYFSTRSESDIKRRTESINMLRKLLADAVLSGSAAVFNFIFAAAIMFYYSSELALIYLVTLMCVVLILHFSNAKTQLLAQACEQNYADYQSSQNDYLTGMEVLKAYSAEDTALDSLRTRLAALSALLSKKELTVRAINTATGTALALGLVLILWKGSGMVIDGKLSFGSLLAFLALMTLATPAIFTVQKLWGKFGQIEIIGERINDILESENEEQRDTGKHNVSSFSGRLETVNLQFNYERSGNKPVLTGVTLKISPGSTVAFTGRDDAGQSTLVKILAGLLPAEPGELFIDNIDSDKLSLSSYRRHTALVEEHPYIFDLSVAKNIAIGDSNPDIRRVMWAARIALADEFIEKLPLGFDTPIGSSGITLSEGEKQRIGIARAIYHDPALLIFDNAMSALSSQIRLALYERLDPVLTSKTVIMVCDHPEILASADKIFVFENGKIVENGTHRELLDRKGLYYFLVSGRAQNHYDNNMLA
ncbi:MAG: ATP-binding cassette domain-containing protein [Candidatus Dadabacteria bacterium]|nr:MAG: ATP-binding cassette domain-containing protein [Candidatus Dadabacteria bacterium]